MLKSFLISKSFLILVKGLTDMEITLRIPDDLWEDFQRLCPHDTDEQHEDRGRMVLTALLADYMGKQEEQFPYDTKRPFEGGNTWNIYYAVPGEQTRLADGCLTPYSDNRKQNADRKRRAMNREWWQAQRMQTFAVRRGTTDARELPVYVDILAHANTLVDEALKSAKITDDPQKYRTQFITEYIKTFVEERGDDGISFEVETGDEVNAIVERYGAIGEEYQGGDDYPKHICHVKSPYGLLYFYASDQETAVQIWESFW